MVLVLYGLSLKWYWYFGMARWLGVSSEIDGIMRRLDVKQAQVKRLQRRGQLAMA
jgi:hypothetical protein